MATGIPHGTTADPGGPGGTAGLGLTVRADAGVSAPGLARLAAEGIAGGIILGAVSAALIWVPARLAAGAG